VINLYYKTPNPGVGEYDVTISDEIGKVLKDPIKRNYKSTFESIEHRDNFRLKKRERFLQYLK
jgi:hypothetical protein